MKNYVFATGFKGSAVAMGTEEADSFLRCVLIEESGVEVTDDEELKKLFNYQIIQRRIDCLKLPISFSPVAYLAMLSLTKSPGGFVTVLIDALNKFEGQCVNVKMLAELYPFGFYSEKSFDDLVDNYLKPHTLKWSEIY